MSLPRRVALGVLGLALWGCEGSNTGSSTGGGSTTTGSSGGSSGGTTGDVEPAQMAGVTAAHNAARAHVSPSASPALPELVWSASLSAVAQAYADRCVFEHSGGDLGENLYASTDGASPADVVGSWVSEAAFYDHASNTCSDACGHYTQVVWRDTRRVGCGVTSCHVNSPFSVGNGNWQLWVCNYDPAGNFVGQKPY